MECATFGKVAMCFWARTWLTTIIVRVTVITFSTWIAMSTTSVIQTHLMNKNLTRLQFREKKLGWKSKKSSSKYLTIASFFITFIASSITLAWYGSSNILFVVKVRCFTCQIFVAVVAFSRILTWCSLIHIRTLADFNSSRQIVPWAWYEDRRL